MTPVPLFHQQQQQHHGATNPSHSQLTSPSAFSHSTSLTSSAQPLDHRSLASSASSSYMSTGLIRPQPRSPHDTEAWDNNSALNTHSPFQQTYGAYNHYQHAHMPVLPTSTPLPPSPSPAMRPTAPFFASLAKHSSLHLASPTPTRPYLPAAVSVYGQFDSAVWQRTPLPKSLSSHPMAVAQSEARRQREEWERENKRLWEIEQERHELLRRGEERQRMQQEMHVRAMQAQAQDEAEQHVLQEEEHTPVVAKRGNAAAIGSRPSQSIRRSAQSAEAGFITPAAKPRRRAEVTAELKQDKVQSASTEKEREERKDSRDPHTGDESRGQTEGAVHEAEEIGDEDVEAGNGSDEGAERLADSDTEDEDNGTTHATPEKESSEVRLSPVKKRSSNRIYTVPSSTHAPLRSSSSSTSALPSSLASAIPPPAAGLKPDMPLTRWYFHIQQHNPPQPPRIVIKGTHATEGPWSSGYVTGRERTTGRVLLTNSRRYVLHGDMEAVEMKREGWSEALREAWADGLPVEWKEWLLREGEQRVQQQEEREARRVSFDFEASDTKTDSDNAKQKNEREEEKKEEATSHRRLSPLIRARRSPAPMRHSEWWEDEIMRLVEAVSMHTNHQHDTEHGGSDTADVWQRVAEEVGGGRRWEECRRKFDEVRREQSRGMKVSEKKKDKVKRFEEREEERRADERKERKASDKRAAKKTGERTEQKDDNNEHTTATSKVTKRSLLSSAGTATSSTHAREKKSTEQKKQHKQKETEQRAAKRDGIVDQIDEDSPLDQLHPTSTSHETIDQAAVQPSHRRPTTPKKRTTTTKPKPSTLSSVSSSSVVSPRTPAAASVEHAVLNPHDVAYTHTRRSGRAVMAPLRHWELEREVNGVILRGFQHAGEAIRRVLTEKEQMEKDGSHTHATQPPHLYQTTKRRLGGGERRAKARAWSVDEREQLRLAYMWVEPSEKGFWLSVSRFMAGRTADECQTEYEKMFPTPKRRGKRKDKDEADEEEKEESAGKEEGKEDGHIKKRKRITTIKREIRDALDSRQQQHNGDDLFDSTPYKNNVDLTHTAALAPAANGRRTQRSTQSSLQQLPSDGEEADASLLFAGDATLADMQVQRVVKERRKMRANRGKAVDAEKRRQGKEEQMSKRGERLAEGANELRLGVRRLETEDEERKQELMDEMEDEVVDDEDEEEEEEDEIVEDSD